jgi:hypothetical protein
MSKLRYTVLSESWYGEAARTAKVFETVDFGLYAQDGGCLWQASFDWMRQGIHNPEPLSLRLTVFHEAFRFFKDHKEFLAELGANPEWYDHAPTVDVIKALLEKHGFQNATERERKS